MQPGDRWRDDVLGAPLGPGETVVAFLDPADPVTPVFAKALSILMAQPDSPDVRVALLAGEAEAGSWSLETGVPATALARERFFALVSETPLADHGSEDAVRASNNAR